MPMADVELRGGRVVLVTGASGSGKSTLLARLGRTFRGRRGRGAWVEFDRVRVPADVRVVDAMAEAMGGGDDDASIVAALEALSRVGLGEVWSYLRRPGELSEGQRWRLRLALALERTPSKKVAPARDPVDVLAADEFAAPLDRVTAMVVARALRRAADARPNLCAVVATSHDDLLGALDPDVVVRCDFDSVTVQERGRTWPGRKAD
jgi:ABC-type ATPase with predicted acetyltransferase domain